jgi:hypothetical protein
MLAIPDEQAQRLDRSSCSSTSCIVRKDSPHHTCTSLLDKIHKPGPPLVVSLTFAQWRRRRTPYFAGSLVNNDCAKFISYFCEMRVSAGLSVNVGCSVGFRPHWGAIAECSFPSPCPTISPDAIPHWDSHIQDVTIPLNFSSIPYPPPRSAQQLPIDETEPEAATN